MASNSTTMKASTASHTVYADETYESRSKRVADKYATDMRITDPAIRKRISTSHYNRSKCYCETKTKYASDTTGTRT